MRTYFFFFLKISVVRQFSSQRLTFWFLFLNSSLSRPAVATLSFGLLSGSKSDIRVSFYAWWYDTYILFVIHVPSESSRWEISPAIPLNLASLLKCHFNPRLRFQLLLTNALFNFPFFSSSLPYTFTSTSCYLDLGTKVIGIPSFGDKS